MGAGAAGGSGTGGRRGLPPGARPNLRSQLILMLSLFFMLFILFDPTFRTTVGALVGVVLQPTVGFGYQYPILTLLLTGLLMTFFSVTVRHFFMDWIEMARNQRIMSAFNRELREARLKQNTYKLRKLMELQPQMMAQSLKSSQAQFKLMPVTMIVIIPIFAWLAVYVIAVPSSIFAVPWQPNADLHNSNVLPNWILLYSLLTLPFAQVLQRSLRYFRYRKRLEELGRSMPQA